MKIDRTFICEFTRDPATPPSSAGSSRSREDLGLDVVAEGVETPEQARLLVELGCPRAQG